MQLPTTHTPQYMALLKLTNPHRAQAHAREEHSADFNAEMILIGIEVRRLRQKQGLSIEKAAKALKISKYRLARIEHGLYIHLDVPGLYRLAALYNVKPLDILAVIPNTSFGQIMS